MPAISLLIKPVSGLCNLDCKYCFYNDITENRQTPSFGKMRGELLEIIVKKAMEQAEGSCSFAFQGGEPTLAGLDFFEQLIELQQKYNTRRLKIFNSIQTNGLAIDDDWASFFNRNNFLVGLSLDGPEVLHDRYRIQKNGETGSFRSVLRATGYFDKHNVDYNILCVITAQACENASNIYRFFKAKKFKYLQFIPCLDPLGEMRGGNAYSLTPESYGVFLKELFDVWHSDFVKGDFISIRGFDNWIQMLMGYPPESCGMSGVCACYFVIEADGGVYPCDFYVLDKYKLGNIADCGFDELASSVVSDFFVSESRHNNCLSCKFSFICRGGCKRDRLDNYDNYYCKAYYGFFEYALERMESVAKYCKSVSF